MISMKNYTKSVVQYLSELLAKHQVTLNMKPTMYLEDFYHVQDTVFGNTQMNKEYGRQLREIYPLLKESALAGYNNHEIFPSLMERMKNQTSPSQVADSLDIMANCLLASPAALVHWHKLY